jgi:hypothetical protein
MKKVFLIILGIALTYGVNAQLRYGIKVGGILSDISFKENGKTKSSDPKVGFELGGILEYSFSSSLSLQPELLFVNNGGIKISNNVFSLTSKYTFNQFQLPINLKYKMGTEQLKFYVAAGPYFGYIFSAKAKHSGGNLQNLFIGDNPQNLFKGKDPMKHVDFGIGVGFGIEFYNKYIVGTGYKYGIANLSRGNETMKIGTFDLSIGYLF